MFNLVLEKTEEPEIKLPLDLLDHRKSKKNIYFCFIDYTKALDCVDHNKLWKYQMGTPCKPASWEICMQVKKQELELDMEQQTDSK